MSLSNFFDPYFLNNFFEGSCKIVSLKITFADRHSIAVIDSDAYLACEAKDRLAQDFYNDTYFSDQTACTSPLIVFWTGTQGARPHGIDRAVPVGKTMDFSLIWDGCDLIRTMSRRVSIL